jgi:hypothetical protein
LEITSLILEPAAEQDEDDTTETEPADVEPTDVEPAASNIEEAPVTGVPSAMAVSGSFHFMQADELESPSDNSGWVNVSQPEEPEVAPIHGHIASAPTSVEAINGHLQPASFAGSAVRLWILSPNLFIFELNCCKDSTHVHPRLGR